MQRLVKVDYSISYESCKSLKDKLEQEMDKDYEQAIHRKGNANGQ